MERRLPIRTLTAFTALVALLAALSVLAFTPGLMTFDSRAQLAQAAMGAYTDHHPPVMAVLWHALLYFHEGPEPMLLLQLAAFWTAIMLLGQSFIRTHPRLCFLFPALWFVPVIMGMGGVIWKDSALALSWLLVAAILVRAQVAGRRPGLAMSALLAVSFLYGFAVRYNTLPGALPLLFWSARIYRPQRAMAVLPMLLAASMGVVNLGTAVLSPQPTHIEQELFLEDIGCMSLRQERSLFPAYIPGDPNDLLSHMRRKQAMSEGALSFNSRDTSFYTSDPAQVMALYHTWRRALAMHPADYLACRVQIYNALMRVGRLPIYPYEIRREPFAGDNIVEIASNRAFSVVRGYLVFFWYWPCNLPWLWMLGGVWLAASSLRRRGVLAGPILALTGSALLYTAGYFFIAVGPDLRYLYWPIAAISLAFVLHIIQLANHVRISRIS